MWQTFWVANGTIKLNTVEKGRIYGVTYSNNLEEFFPDNEVSADEV